MRLFSMPAVTAAFVVATSLGCGGPTDSQRRRKAPPCSERGGPALFARNARPYGTSMERWSELVWKWIYRQPAGVQSAPRPHRRQLRR